MCSAGHFPIDSHETIEWKTDPAGMERRFCQTRNLGAFQQAGGFSRAPTSDWAISAINNGRRVNPDDASGIDRRNEARGTGISVPSRTCEGPVLQGVRRRLVPRASPLTIASLNRPLGMSR